MKQTACFLLFLVPSVLGINSWQRGLINEDPDIDRNVSELIVSKGYPVEDHSVTTEDGYILSLQHIPYGRDGECDTGYSRKAVLVVHGLFSSADNFVFNFPNESLGFILADYGYDVWLGNIRGSTYSKKHVKYSTLQPEFWDFSLDEMAAYDLPAMIDYVLRMTGRPTLFYVGHSQGTMAAFALLSEKPEYNNKINLFAALAPAAYLGNIPWTIDRVFFYFFNYFGPLLGNQEVSGNNFLKYDVKELFCGTIVSDLSLCTAAFIFFLGDDHHINKTRIPVYVGHFPASTSSKNLVHLGQEVVYSTFRKFDYGMIGNMAHYNQPTPPEYDLTRITAPVALLSAQADDLADPADVDIIRSKVPSLVADYSVPDAEFMHVDFIAAMQAKPLVYDYLLGLLQKF